VIDYTLRCIVLTVVAESAQSSSLEEVEQKILQELMEVVQQRDALVALLEEDRIKSDILLLLLVSLSVTLYVTLCIRNYSIYN